MHGGVKGCPASIARSLCSVTLRHLVIVQPKHDGRQQARGGGWALERNAVPVLSVTAISDSWLIVFFRNALLGLLIEKCGNLVGDGVTIIS